MPFPARLLFSGRLMAPTVAAANAYEFPLFKRGGLGVGVDYDARVRADGRAALTVLSGLRFSGYPPEKW